MSTSSSLSIVYCGYLFAKFIIVLADESKPSYGHGTLVAVPLLRRPEKYQTWQATIESAEDNNLRVQIIPSPECVVAKWRMEVDTKALDDGAYSYCWETGIYILFNPWCKQDQVFLKSEEWRQEAVLSDVGLIWRGTFNRQRPCIWKYSQFDKDVLDSSLFLVNQVGKVRGGDRADPVVTARALSAAVNSVDDDGAVMGNWSENFGGGVPPTDWMGSGEILQKYWKKKRPVKYGQCWVFAGVLTSGEYWYIVHKANTNLNYIRRIKLQCTCGGHDIIYDRISNVIIKTCINFY